MFLKRIRALTRLMQPVTFFSRNISSIPTGITSITVIPTVPYVLQAISYKRTGGHTFDFKVTVSGRVNSTSPWETVLESPLTPNPQTPETDIFISEAQQKAYSEYLILTESFATQSRIASLVIAFKQLQFGD